MSSSRWCNPPSDILPVIADHLDSNLGLLHLRSVCQSWRSSLPPPPPTLTFPLQLPPLPSTTSPNLSLHHRTLYLLSPLNPPPPPMPPSSGFILSNYSTNYIASSSSCFLMKVEQIARANENAESSNTFSLFSRVKLPPPNSPINLLDFRIISVGDSYVAAADTDLNPIKKVVVANEKGDFVVLGLKYNGGLLVWKFGDENWTEITSGVRYFDDIICYNGKIYATANKNGMLVINESGIGGYSVVFDVKTGDSCFVVDSEGFARFYWPPLSWFVGADTDCFR